MFLFDLRSTSCSYLISRVDGLTSSAEYTCSYLICGVDVLVDSIGAGEDGGAFYHLIVGRVFLYKSQERITNLCLGSRTHT